MTERLEMIFALSELDVSVIPLNVLVPIDGTPLEVIGRPILPILSRLSQSAVWCTLARSSSLRPAETVMKDFQGAAHALRRKRLSDRRLSHYPREGDRCEPGAWPSARKFHGG